MAKQLNIKKENEHELFMKSLTSEMMGNFIVVVSMIAKCGGECTTIGHLSLNNLNFVVDFWHVIKFSVIKFSVVRLLVSIYEVGDK